MSIPDLLTTLPTKSLRLPVGVTPNNDPQVIYDGTQWVMFHSTPVGGGNCYYRTAPTQDGPWSNSILITTLYGKPYILVDGLNNPVKIGGLYQMFTLGTFNIGRMTSPTLATASWTDRGTELPHNPAVSQQPDGFGILAVCARWLNNQIYLLYMGCPGTNGVSTADSTYGFASMPCYATSPTGGSGTYTRGGAWIFPSTSLGDWDYGFMGPADLYLNNDGVTYSGIYGGGPTRPSTSGNEPSVGGPQAGGPVRLGGFTTTGLPGVGVVTKYSGNPIVTPDNPTTGDPEYGNVWRGFASWDGTYWRWWYNTGPYGLEHIAYASSPSLPSLWATPFSDNFSRGNGPIGNGWTDTPSPGADFAIVSNQLTCGNTSGGVALAYRGSDVYTQDQRVKVTTPGFSTGRKSFANTRIAASNSFYYASIDPSNVNVVRLVKVVAGVNTGIQDVVLSSPIVSGRSYRIELACRSSSPTLLCVSVFDITASAWLAQNVQASSLDTEATLQPANPTGFMAQVSSGTYVATLVTVENGFFTPPVAAFSGTPLSGSAPLSVTLTDASTNTPSSWLWEKSSDVGVTWSNFSDTPTAQNPVEIFSGGTWSIRLTATNGAGSNQLVKTNYITVQPSGLLLRQRRSVL